MIPATRDLLEEIGLPYLIENVENARKEMITPIRLCGSSFGLRVRRHRFFETSFPVTPPACNHQWQLRHKPYLLTQSASHAAFRKPYSGTIPVHGGGQIKGGDDHFYSSVAMGIDWMNRAELNQAIPPVYTYYLGRRLMQELG